MGRLYFSSKFYFEFFATDASVFQTLPKNGTNVSPTTPTSTPVRISKKSPRETPPGSELAYKRQRRTEFLLLLDSKTEKEVPKGAKARVSRPEFLSYTEGMIIEWPLTFNGFHFSMDFGEII